jgi:hypothetical protein
MSWSPEPAHAQALRTARFCHLAIVNGAHDVIVQHAGRSWRRSASTVDRRISAFDIVADPAKLPAHLAIEA